MTSLVSTCNIPLDGNPCVELESPKKVTILIPAFNEEDNIRHLIEELDRISNIDEINGSHISIEWEYLFVNDGSSDNTLDILNDQRQNNNEINIVNLSRNFGKENAMLAGMDYASGDAIIIMDADLQDPVDCIPQMIYWWLQGYDDVYGMRKNRGKESWLRKHLSLLFYRLLQSTTRIEILQNVGDFRLLDRRVVDAIKSLRETQRYTKGLYCWVGFKKKEIVFDREDRTNGKSSFNLKSLFNLAIEGITCFTTSPLRISSVIGFIVSILALVYLFVVLFKTIIWGEPVRGFPTLLSAILLLGGVQLIAIGIIGEYIARIYNETKMRPPYIVESFNGKKK
ncbi:MAG: glycosyltransferase family 2 protein [Lepagella sp.]